VWELTGCEILGKAEFMNPAGSVKGRAAYETITDAEQAVGLNRAQRSLRNDQVLQQELRLWQRGQVV